jgi:hypothetical protein
VVTLCLISFVIRGYAIQGEYGLYLYDNSGKKSTAIISRCELTFGKSPYPQFLSLDIIPLLFFSLSGRFNGSGN